MIELPARAYKGGSDALWLADYARSGIAEKGLFAELGTGCATAAMAFLQQNPPLQKWQGIGLEIAPELVSAAQETILQAKLQDKLQIICADIADRNILQQCRQQYGGFDLVFANPPWRCEGQGRIPPEPMRRRALFASSETLPLFCSAAALLLKKGGHFVCIVGASRLADCCVALRKADLTPRSMRLLYPSAEKDAILVLLDSVLYAHGIKEGLLRVQPPVFLT